MECAVRRGVERAYRGPVRTGNAGERHRGDWLLQGLLVSAVDPHAGAGAWRGVAAALRRRRPRGHRLVQRSARRTARGRLHTVHHRRHAVSVSGGGADHRGPCRGRSGRSGETTRQAGLAARAAFDLVSAHHRHLADGLDRSGTGVLGRSPALDAQPGTLGNRFRSVGRRSHRRPVADARPPSCGRHDHRRRHLHGRRRRSAPPNCAVGSGHRRLPQRVALESGAADADHGGD